MQYELIVETVPDQNMVKFRLLDEHGAYKASHEVKLTDHRPTLWEGLFDTRRHVDRYEHSLLWEGATEPETAEEILARLGVFLGRHVLGAEIVHALTGSKQRRTLLVKLPPSDDNLLAAAFARVPYEIARLKLGEPTLMERNLVVRVLTEDTAKGDATIAEAAAQVASGATPLRVLLVFAEAPGSRPLAMRQERQELLNLFYQEILPKKQVQIGVLCHGVTRPALTEQIKAANGYHIVHWSGHGHHNLLELRGGDGQKDYISGKELVQLLMDAGGFMPQIIFLSACLSGTFVNVQDWAAFQALLLSQKPDQKQAAPVLPDLLKNPSGYTGTALELLRCGVPQVIAMRYEVGDDYARQLAWWFYKRLLADPGKRPTDDALALARTDLLKDPQKATQLGAVDHATPLIFGQAGRLLEPVEKRSKQMNRLRPQPQPLLPAGNRELEQPDNFVGRSAELTQLNGQWLGQGDPAVALVQGLAGMGKTALAAEAIHLWHTRFDYVFALQAKPTELMLDEFYRQMDFKLTTASAAYRDKCDASPFSRVYLETGQHLKGAARYEQMRNNLIEVLRDEAILIVLDNFEANLAPHPLTPSPIGEGEQGRKVSSRLSPSSIGKGEQGGEVSSLSSLSPIGEGAGGEVSSAFACKDPQWDHLLAALCRELPGTRSRLLITSRHLPAALQKTPGVSNVLWIQLGPLPTAEAALYIRSHPKLRALFFADEEGSQLVQCVMDISRGHPLIMDRLAVLADNRLVLAQALDALENKGWRSLPDLFARTTSASDRERERKYLEDAVIGSVDFLIKRLSPDARRLLWLITQANEPVLDFLLERVWETPFALSLSKGENSRFDKLTANGHALPPIASLLAELTTAGLISQETTEHATYAFHELVRERMTAWMQTHPAEQGGWTAEQIWIAYGERYQALFEQLQTSGQENAMVAATEMGRRGLTYFVRIRAFDKLGGFASALVTGTSDPTMLRGVIVELQTVAEQVPTGRERWLLRLNLADALNRSGRPDQSLMLYEQAVAEAEAAEDWSDVGAICGNWAIALCYVDQLDRAKATYRRCVNAYHKAGAPKIQIIGNELAALRIDVKQGNATDALPEIEKRLNEVRDWQRRSRAGESAPDAPDPVFLDRVLVGGLDIAEDANRQLERWEACLALLEEQEQTKRDAGESRHEQYITRFNRYEPLMELGRLNDAQRVVEECLAVFEEADDLTRQTRALSALANIWNERGDFAQAIALERQVLSIWNRLPNPSDRAISHGNLSNYLEKAGKLEDMARHSLAAIIYCLIAKRHDHLATFSRNLGIDMHRAVQAGGRYDLPRLADLLARPAFDALNQFLAQWGVDVPALQSHIDQLVAQVRQEAA